MARIPSTPEEGKENLSKAIDKYLENILKVLPPDKRNQIISEIQKGRAIKTPPPATG